MNNTDINDQNHSFGYWLKAADRLRSMTLQQAFEVAGADRRDWRMLRRLDDSIMTPHPLRERKLGKMVARGWVIKQRDAWVLTDEGRELKRRLDLAAEGVLAQVVDAVSADDLETTQRTLEQIARIYGWEEGARLPRFFGRQHRGTEGYRRGACEHHGRGSQRWGGDHFGHGGSGRRGGGHGDQRLTHLAGILQDSYERGFSAGLSLDRDA